MTTAKSLSLQINVHKILQTDTVPTSCSHFMSLVQRRKIPWSTFVLYWVLYLYSSIICSLTTKSPYSRDNIKIEISLSKCYFLHFASFKTSHTSSNGLRVRTNDER